MKNSFKTYFKYRAVWRDLFALPPAVLVKRVKKRLLKKQGNPFSVTTEIDPFFECSKISLAVVDKSKTEEFVVKNYLDDKADFLGSGWVEHTDWQKDEKSGFRWDEKLPSSEQLTLGLNVKNADVKLPWEFARMHQLLKVSLYTDVKRAENYTIKTFNDFCEKSPVGFGVNWMNAMEASIRVVNVLVATDVLKIADKTLLRNIQEHLVFILNHLEKKEGLANNHYLANLTGLLFGLVYFPKWEGLQKQRNFVVKEFCHEIEKQFYTDGGNFEGSTYYHALSTEIAVLGLACLLRLYENEAVAKTKNQIYKAVAFLKDIAKPNLELPQYGDNDSGRILPLSLKGVWLTPTEAENKYKHLAGYANGKTEEIAFFENVLDVSGVIAFGDALFGKGDFSSPEGKFIKQFCGSLTAIEKPAKFNKELKDPGVVLPVIKEWSVDFQEIDLDKIQANYFPNFGIVVLKSDEFYLSVSLLKRRKAHRYRGHFHNDQLSIDLWVKGEQLLADPGNVTYTGDLDLRNNLRSARAHNAPYIFEEPNRFMPGILGLFHNMDETNTELYQLNNRKIRAALFFKNEKIVREISISKNHIHIHDSASKPFVVNTKNDVISDGYGKELNE